MNHVNERPADPLTLLLHPAEGSEESILYEDSGNGFDYERGEYARRLVICKVTGGEVSVHLTAREGSFSPERSSVNLELRGVSTRPESVKANGEEADYSYKEAGGKLTVRLAESAGETMIKVRF